jgi:hypothetical protein
MNDSKSDKKFKKYNYKKYDTNEIGDTTVAKTELFESEPVSDSNKTTVYRNYL